MKSALALAMVFAATAQAADTLKIFGRTWTVPVLSDWKAEGGVLHLVKSRGPLPGPRRPMQFALTDVPPYQRLRLEADVMASGHSLLMVFAYRDAAHFDYAHLSTDTADAQPMHNGIFHVYGRERVRISSAWGPAALPHSGRWYHVTLRHIASSGSVRVTVDGQEAPDLHAIDLSLGAGKVGLGSFDETGAFRNVKISVER
jgi:hypothetical protein